MKNSARFIVRCTAALLVVTGGLLASSVSSQASTTISPFLNGTTSSGQFEAGGYNNSLAMDSSGGIWSVNGIGGSVVKADVRTERPTTFTRMVAPSQMGGELAAMISFGADDALWVVTTSGNVFLFPSGFTSGTNGTMYADGTSIAGGPPNGITVVGARVYLSNFSGTVVSFPTGLSSGALPVTTGTSFATGLVPAVQGLTTDGTSVVVADDGQNNGEATSGIYRLTTTGGPYTSPAYWIDCTAIPGIIPVGVTFAPDGTFYVSSYNKGIYVASPNSTTVTLMIDANTIMGQYPDAMVADGTTLFATGLSADPLNVVFAIDMGPLPTTTTTQAPTTTMPATSTTVSPGRLASTGFPFGRLVALGGVLLGLGTLARRKVRRV